eukprot:CAMPEP_0176406138 /NCGR_PEP_ID=MMETSP0127-20121128/712_1 /TAXON_ID=938130 /ORGANISM="Platyophrya macrostoma, Strain WH" /LENGTH=106 /DNA_ID=CAMNT_0017785245 /DNA_START=250 /DNA_END=570 /DNA_ORIENTATION=+
MINENFGFFNTYKGKGIFNIFLSLFIAIPDFYATWLDVIVNIFAFFTFVVGVFYFIHGLRNDDKNPVESIPNEPNYSPDHEKKADALDETDTASHLDHALQNVSMA